MRLALIPILLHGVLVSVCDAAEGIVLIPSQRSLNEQRAAKSKCLLELTGVDRHVAEELCRSLLTHIDIQEILRHPLAGGPNSEVRKLLRDKLLRDMGGDGGELANVIRDPMRSVRELFEGIRATRTFVGPQNFPPRLFSAYGVVAFPRLRTSNTRARYIAICQAYWAALIESSNASESGVSPEEQMVTVWPVETEELAKKIISEDDMVSGCEKVVDEYDLWTAQLAIQQAGGALNTKFQGRGPFLLAWAPSTAKGRRGVPVLFADLSNATTEEQYFTYFEKWRELIQEKPELWREEEGWSVERVRTVFREFVDSAGNEILTFVTGADK